MKLIKILLIILLSFIINDIKAQNTGYEYSKSLKYHFEASNDSIHFKSIGTIYCTHFMTEESFKLFMSKIDITEFKYYQIREINNDNGIEYYGKCLYIIKNNNGI